ncbi:hypothetical protein ACN469_13110, partial [Corallococcus terminator]
MTRNGTRARSLSTVVVLGLLAFDLIACGPEPETEEASRMAAELGDTAPSTLDDDRSRIDQELGDGNKNWSPPPAPTGCGRMYANQGLAAGERLYSCDGRFWLAQQGDGNLVLRQGGLAL